ncbi:MAG: dihydroorotate dehydrogenase electron transfer subunit [Actinomycetaceae bacterium]|nr:dihydroorotate dehydrogenase electron transfer subunit [Arcanobacterium sp.]MDD7504562.1 dihydroorotate dehydrogenase electron transfer subunit [Actinomycetaceae bacterium]MDY6143205.1 dihydroorotate dehydrogenase electron transfer subunit [Arcanobacterium sp.]
MTPPESSAPTLVHAAIGAHREIAPHVYELRLGGDFTSISTPGQFVNVGIPGFILKRPISVCDISADRRELVLVYKVIGEGTAALARLKPGACLEILSGLGNGFDVAKAGQHPVLVGGGVGIPPLYWLAKELLRSGVKPTVVLGFNTAREIFYADKFASLGADVIVTTIDATYGTQGYATAAFEPFETARSRGASPAGAGVGTRVGEKALGETAFGETALGETALGETRLAEAASATRDSRRIEPQAPISRHGYSFIYACGPLPMLRALHPHGAHTGGQYSFEERMACGFGACMGCSVKTAGGTYKRLCKEGPVLDQEEILWEA